MNSRKSLEDFVSECRWLRCSNCDRTRDILESFKSDFQINIYQLRLDELVDDKVHHRLADAKVARCDALVEGSNAALCIDPFDALSHRHLHLRVVVQLQTRLHKPNGIRRRRCDKASACSAHNVNQGRIALNETRNWKLEEQSIRMIYYRHIIYIYKQSDASYNMRTFFYNWFSLTPNCWASSSSVNRWKSRWHAMGPRPPGWVQDLWTKRGDLHFVQCI